MTSLHFCRHISRVLNRHNCICSLASNPVMVRHHNITRPFHETRKQHKTYLYTSKASYTTKAKSSHTENGRCTAEKTQLISFSDRSHLCGSLTASNVGQVVKLCGWVDRSSKLFLKIYDWTGKVQIAVPDHMADMVRLIERESVVEINGTVVLRPEDQRNVAMGTGEVEVQPTEIKVLSPCQSHVPFYPTCVTYPKVSSDVRMKHRYLDIRSMQMQKILRLRSSFIMKVREFLCNDHGFVDVETPTLFRKTPGGAQEFMVPTRHKGRFYSLPQSPQQFKQLLMVGGIDRYFQIARCYRDEQQRTDRQPEFTQLDMEMSFTSQTHIMGIVEHLLHHCWPTEAGTLPPRFPVMTYDQAMTDYGTDKPDTRFGMKLHDITDVVSDCRVERLESAEAVTAVRIPQGMKHFSNKELETLCKNPKATDATEIISVKVQNVEAWKSSISKQMTSSCREVIGQRLELDPGDVLLLCLGDKKSACEVLGKKRLESADHLEQKGMNIRNSEDYNILWIVDFPLFLPKEDECGSVVVGDVESTHHPFTAPVDEDVHLVYTDPCKVRSQHYDLVLNGNEIGGGSVRLHNAQLQRYVFSEILKEDTRDLSHLLEALDMGCPPHAGIALGLDRLFAILSGANNIKDVIAFPKTFMGYCAMSKAPSELSETDLASYHLQLKS